MPFYDVLHAVVLNDDHDLPSPSAARSMLSERNSMTADSTWTKKSPVLEADDDASGRVASDRRAPRGRRDRRIFFMVAFPDEYDLFFQDRNNASFAVDIPDVGVYVPSTLIYL